MGSWSFGDSEEVEQVGGWNGEEVYWRGGAGSRRPSPSMFYLIRRTLRLACLENCRFPNISSHSKVLFRCSSGTICLSIIFHTRPSLASNTQVAVEPDGSIQFVRSSLMIDLYRYLSNLHIFLERSPCSFLCSSKTLPSPLSVSPILHFETHFRPSRN